MSVRSRRLAVHAVERGRFKPRLKGLPMVGHETRLLGLQRPAHGGSDAKQDLGLVLGSPRRRTSWRSVRSIARPFRRDFSRQPLWRVPAIF
jgi:hypothetical protein